MTTLGPCNLSNPVLCPKHLAFSTQSGIQVKTLNAEYSPENLRALTLRWFQEVWNERRISTIHELMAEDNTSHGLTSQLPGSFAKSEFIAFHNQILTAFPDIRFRVDQVIIDRDRSAVRFTMSGTHRGDLRGLPASNLTFRVSGQTIIRWEKGRAVEAWNNYDQLGLLQQIGFITEHLS